MKNLFKFKKNKLGAKVQARDSKTIQQDYVNACAQYGAKLYQINVLKEEATQLFKQIKELNGEAYVAFQATPKGDGEPTPEAVSP